MASMVRSTSSSSKGSGARDDGGEGEADAGEEEPLSTLRAERGPRANSLRNVLLLVNRRELEMLPESESNVVLVALRVRPLGKGEVVEEEACESRWDRGWTIEWLARSRMAGKDGRRCLGEDPPR